MKILEVRSLSLAGIKVIRYARFRDHRGYFTEIFRKSDFLNHPQLSFLHGVEFHQCNESYSRAGTVRGLHFQWNPYMGKLVRTLNGHMIDLVLDIRRGSGTFGKIIAYDMPAGADDDGGEWIWVPPGFAHGNFFRQDTYIEYYCSGEYSPTCEAGISPLAPDIDWSLAEPQLKQSFDALAPTTGLITEKDKNGYSVAEWQASPDSARFVFSL